MLVATSARAVRVAVRPRRLGVDDRGERGGDPVERARRPRSAPVRRLPAGEVGLGERRPERRVAAERAERCAPAPDRTSGRCAGGPPRRRPRSPPAEWKISTRLGEAQDAPEQRDLVAGAARAAGRGRPSARRASGSPRPCARTGRCMRAISAPRSQRACISDRVTSPSSLIASRRSSRVRSEPPGRDRAHRPHERRQRARPVDALGGVLGRHGRRPRTAPPSAPSSPCSRRP